MFSKEYDIEDLEEVACDLMQMGHRNIRDGWESNGNQVNWGYIYLDLYEVVMKEIERREKPGILERIRGKFR